MDLGSRIGVSQPEVLIVAKGGRDIRRERLLAGQTDCSLSKLLASPLP